jgi:hypothetical protein
MIAERDTAGFLAEERRALGNGPQSQGNTVSISKIAIIFRFPVFIIFSCLLCFFIGPQQVIFLSFRVSDHDLPIRYGNVNSMKKHKLHFFQSLI